MTTFNLDQSIHFITQNTEEKENIKRDFFTEINSFYNYILNTNQVMKITFNNHDYVPGNNVSIKYNFESENIEIDPSSLSLRYLKLNFLEDPAKSTLTKLSSSLNINKKLFFKPVGKIINSNAEAPIMPLLTQERDGQRWQIPIVKPISRLATDCHWKFVLNNLSRKSGTLAIQIKPYVPEVAEKNYAWQCLQLFIKTYKDKISDEEFELNTKMLRAIIEEEAIFIVKFFANSKNSEALRFSLLQDLDIKAFQSQSHQQLPSIRYRNNLLDLKQYIKNLQCLWTQEEIIDNLLMPPYSFENALSGMNSLIPLPFNIPYVEHQDNSSSQLSLGKISDSQQEIYLDRELLRRHLFVTGSNGSGKGNTVKHLLGQMPDIPLLIIDPIKTDYESIMKQRGSSKNILDFSLGKMPQFNPFIPAPNITLYDHAALVSRFLAILSPGNDVALNLIQNMVKQTYWTKLRTLLAAGKITLPDYSQVKGFTLDNFLAIDGRFLRENPISIPSFQDYLDISMLWLEKIANKNSKWGQDTISYFQRRKEYLEKSIIFKVMDSQEPIDLYFESDYLIELQRISEPTEKNALFVIFSLLLYEYRRSQGEQNSLRHITILEEAHRIIPSQQKGLGENRAVSAEDEAATLVAQMLAEIRAFGEGIIVVDQSPNKILSDALINCNTKIIHSLGFGKDKQTLAEALSLSEREKNFLSYLDRGKAIALHPELYQPIYLNIPKAL